MTPQELADYLKMSERWVRAQARNGMPHVRLGQGRNAPLRFRLSHVEAYLDSLA